MIKSEKGSVLLNGSTEELHNDMVGILVAITKIDVKLAKALILSSIGEVLAGVAPEGKTVTIDKEELLKQMEEEKGNA